MLILCAHSIYKNPDFCKWSLRKLGDENVECLPDNMMKFELEEQMFMSNTCSDRESELARAAAHIALAAVHYSTPTVEEVKNVIGITETIVKEWGGKKSRWSWLSVSKKVDVERLIKQAKGELITS